MAGKTIYTTERGMLRVETGFLPGCITLYFPEDWSMGSLRSGQAIDLATAILEHYGVGTGEPDSGVARRFSELAEELHEMGYTVGTEDLALKLLAIEKGAECRS